MRRSFSVHVLWDPNERNDWARLRGERPAFLLRRLPIEGNEGYQGLSRLSRIAAARWQRVPRIRIRRCRQITAISRGSGCFPRYEKYLTLRILNAAEIPKSVFVASPMASRMQSSYLDRSRMYGLEWARQAGMLYQPRYADPGENRARRTFIGRHRITLLMMMGITALCLVPPLWIYGAIWAMARFGYWAYRNFRL